MQPIISIKGVSHTFGSAQVLRDINLTIRSGDFVALLGPNGSGKTTLIKLLLGSLAPSKGSITLFGSSVSWFNKWHLIGYVPQQNIVDRNFPATVEEILTLKKSSAYPQVLTYLDIKELRYKKFLELSGGQQQRVLIAFSLLTKPRLLILDEPTVGVDSQAQKEFYALLKRLNEYHGVTILLITHDIGIVPHFAKTVVFLNQKVCCVGPAKKTKELMKEAYGNREVFHHHD